MTEEDLDETLAKCLEEIDKTSRDMSVSPEFRLGKIQELIFNLKLKVLGMKKEKAPDDNADPRSEGR